MSVTYGFYNSINGDRKYDAVDLCSIFDGIINDGIYMSIGDKMMLSTTNLGMSVIIGTGRAWFEQTWTRNTAPLPITIPESDLLYDRIDAVILEVNKNDESRANSFKVIQGNPAVNPTKPDITNGGNIFRYPLGYIRVRKGATIISSSDIENAVGTLKTPFVTGIIETMAIDELLTQWSAEWGDWNNQRTLEFNTWFNDMQDQLTTDAAGNLQFQITDLSNGIDRSNRYRSFQLSLSGWIGYEADVVSYTIPIADVTPDDRVEYDVDMGSVYGRKSDIEPILEAYSEIYDVETYSGGIRILAMNKPKIAFSILIKGV